ncbi:MAG: c-type cytochrome [Pseudomonadales bacterium]
MKTSLPPPRQRKPRRAGTCPTWAFVVALGALGSTAPAWSADPGNGEYLAFKYHCMTCHGERGRSADGRYPNLAGQHAAYIQARLNYFRSAVEPGNQMNAQAVHLEDEEIADLAAYFGEQRR